MLHLVVAIGWRLLLVAGAVAGLALACADGYALSAGLLGGACAVLMLDAVRLARRPVRIDRTPLATTPDEARKMHRVEALLDAVTVALFLLGPDDRITYANRAGRRIAGYQSRLADVPGAGGQAADMLAALRPGGRRIVTFADGRMMLAWLGSFSDGTGPAQRLLSLQLVAGELDAVQLEAWQSMSRVLAHEIMNSLTPITSLSQSLCAIVRRDDLGGEVIAALDTIARRSASLMEFVTRYREVADIPTPQMREVETGPLLDGIAVAVRQVARGNGTSVDVATGDAPARFVADPDLLESALLNLAINAAEALAAHDCGQISLRAAAGADSLRFEVADDGPGLPADMLEAIFVPFFTTKRAGSGIGLALARQVAILHGGMLTAHQRPQGGMVFRLSVAIGRPD